LQPFTPLLQPARIPRQRAVGEHDWGGNQLQKIRRRQPLMMKRFYPSVACDALLLATLEGVLLLIHHRTIALFRRKGMRDHLTRGNYFCGIPAPAGRAWRGMVEHKGQTAAMISWRREFLTAWLFIPGDMQQRCCCARRHSIPGWCAPRCG